MPKVGIGVKENEQKKRWDVWKWWRENHSATILVDFHSRVPADQERWTGHVGNDCCWLECLGMETIYCLLSAGFASLAQSHRSWCHKNLIMKKRAQQQCLLSQYPIPFFFVRNGKQYFPSLAADWNKLWQHGTRVTHSAVAWIEIFGHNGLSAVIWHFASAHSLLRPEMTSCLILIYL